jgi:hypothetical protein
MLKMTNFGTKRLLNRNKVDNRSKLTVFQPLNVIVRPAYGFQFDMPDLDELIGFLKHTTFKIQRNGNRINKSVE